MRTLFKIAFPVLALALMAVIYVVKYETWQLKREVKRLEQQIDEEKERIVVLRANWAYLTRPERIERLARAHLKMKPPSPDQFGVLDQ